MGANMRMIFSTIAFFLTLVSLFSPRAVIAQNPPGNQVLPPTPSVSAGMMVPGEGYGWWGEAGTPQSSAARGLADVIRSQGQYNALTGQGLVSLSQAQRQFIENRKAGVENYFAVREINREMRAKERGRRGTYEDWVRYAQAGAPARLSPGELDHVSGRISWPVLLRSDKFANSRGELEKLFAFRAVSGQLSTDEFLRIDELTRGLADQLQTRVASLPPQEYVRAKRFVQSLSYEAMLPPV